MIRPKRCSAAAMLTAVAWSVCGWVSAATAAPVFVGQAGTEYAVAVDPAELAFGPGGELYAGQNDPSNNDEKIYRIPPGGGTAVEWGTIAPRDPDGIAVLGGDVYAAGHEDIFRTDIATGTTVTWADWSSGRNMTTLTAGVPAAYGGAGDLIVGNARWDYDIEFVSGTTQLPTVRIDSPDLHVPRALQFAAGTLYCTETAESVGIWSIAPNGDLARVPDGGFAWGDPRAMAYDPEEDTFYICDSGRGEMVRLPRAGGTCEVVGTGFDNIGGLAFGPDGRLYAADEDNNVVWQLAPEPASLTLLLAPAAVCLLRRRR